MKILGSSLKLLITYWSLENICWLILSDDFQFVGDRDAL